MIKIGKPIIEEVGGAFYLSSFISSEKANISQKIWYRTTAEWSMYLTDETADAFLLPMLLVALRTQEDILVEAPVSEKLYYNIKYNILYTLSIPLKVNYKLDVKCDHLVTPEFHSFAVGCGCSLGVDSFSAMIRHMSDDCPKGFRITHLTNFNVGAYGNNFEKSHSFFEDALGDVRRYSKEKQMPLVLLESNFGLFFEGVNFNLCGPVRTMSAVLALQKLFKRYYYASGSTNEDFKYTDTMCEFASLLLPMFSTENTDIIVADQDKNRIKKTASIVKSDDAHHYLDVCWKRIKANKGDTRYLQYPYRNCTRCSKCERTVLTLDILGCLYSFKDVFDTDYFYNNRDEIVRKYISRRNENHYFQEVFQLMVEKGYPLPKETRISKIAKWLKRCL